MDDLGEEEDLFDTDFGDVPVNTLHQLERDAITLSQRPHPAHQLGDGDVQRASIHGYETAGTGLQGQYDQMTPHAPSSDYGFDDEDVIDLDDPSVSFAADAPPVTNQHATSAAHRQPRNAFGVDTRTAAPLASRSTDQAQLQRRLTELEQDHIRLISALEDAQNDVITKTGAIATLRARNDRAVKEHEAKLAEIRQKHAEDRAKLKAEAQVAKNAQETIKTSNRFLEHDLAEERERIKRLRNSNSNGTNTKSARARDSTTVTPQKTQSHAFRDGFDDHEILAPSPTKVKEKGKQRTPKAGQKRKRNAAGSPPIHVTDSPGRIESPLKVPVSRNEIEQEAIAMAKLAIKDERMRMIQLVLNHRSESTGKRSLEALSTFPLPGSKDGSMASIVLEGLSSLPSEDVMPTSVAIRNICLDLWDRCLKASYWVPLTLVLEIFQSMLRGERSAQQTMLLERSIILSVRTSVIVAEPRIPQSGQPNKSIKRHSQPTSGQHIDDVTIMTILHTIAVGAAIHPDRCQAFWQRMEFGFPLLMLQRTQPVTQIHLMLRMLSTSILADSFGPRHVNPGEQIQQEASLLDRLTCLLHEKLEPSQVFEDVLDLRLGVLRTLRAISATRHGCLALAQHVLVIGRLNRFLCNQIASLYRILPIAIPLDDNDDDQDSANRGPAMPQRHIKTTETINLATRILYHLLHEQEVNLLEKLAAVHGGNQKFMIAFSRLAFSERLLLEAGIEPGVIEAAHEILDAVLNPEEGEALVQAMDMSQG